MNKRYGEFHSKRQESGKDIYTFIISTEDLDLHGERMKISGIDITKFKKNPVVYFNHNSSGFPIGKAVDIYKKDGKLLADTIFHEEDKESRLIKKLVDTGYLNATSIGFKPLEWEDSTPTDDEANQLNATWSNQVRTYTKSQLLEYSIVGIPANSEAIRDKGLTEDEIELYKKAISKEQKPETVYYSIIEPEEKAGRVLSKKNKENLQSAIEKIQSVLDSDTSETDPEPEKIFTNDNVNEYIIIEV